jgi:hypothetical protein
VTSCRRFETEGLLLLQEGRPLDEHFDRCPDCRAARDAYGSLEKQLAALASESVPPPEWQRDVWTVLARRPRPVRVPRLLWMGAAAAAVILAVWVARRSVQPPAGGRVLVAEIERGGQAFRGTGDAHPGDVLVLQARVGTAPHAELRLYQDDRRLIAACSASPPCYRGPAGLGARIVLPSIGSYQPVLLLSDSPLPAATGRLDEDSGEASRRGARVELGEPIAVR